MEQPLDGTVGDLYKVGGKEIFVSMEHSENPEDGLLAKSGACAQANTCLRFHVFASSRLRVFAFLRFCVFASLRFASLRLCVFAFLHTRVSLLCVFTDSQALSC